LRRAHQLGVRRFPEVEPRATAFLPAELVCLLHSETACGDTEADYSVLMSSSGIESMAFDPEQARALDLVEEGRNLFITGAAGTGKSHVVRAAIALLWKKYGRDAVAVTAPSGLAAVNINGTTLHSFAGIGRGGGSKEELARLVRGNSHAHRRWRECRALVVDEISQLDGNLLDALDFIARKVRPVAFKKFVFSKIQLIFVGDFAQLRPVDSGSKFAFQAACWNSIFAAGTGYVVLLRQCHRVASSEMEMLSHFTNVRKGQVTRAAIEWFESRCISPPDDATWICATNKQVSEINSKHLKKLQGKGKTYTYDATDSALAADANLLTRVPKHLELRVGARVLLLATIDTSLKLVNGMRGTVVGFQSVDGERSPVVRFEMRDKTFERVVARMPIPLTENGESLGFREQLPLDLAYAITIHKAQGMEFDSVAVNLNKIFESGQAYTALTRAKCSKGLFLSGFDERFIHVHPQVRQFLEHVERVAALESNGSSPPAENGKNQIQQCEQAATPPQHTPVNPARATPPRESSIMLSARHYSQGESAQSAAATPKKTAEKPSTARDSISLYSPSLLSPSPSVVFIEQAPSPTPTIIDLASEEDQAGHEQCGDAGKRHHYSNGQLNDSPNVHMEHEEKKSPKRRRKNKLPTPPPPWQPSPIWPTPSLASSEDRAETWSSIPETPPP